MKKILLTVAMLISLVAYATVISYSGSGVVIGADFYCEYSYSGTIILDDESGEITYSSFYFHSDCFSWLPSGHGVDVEIVPEYNGQGTVVDLSISSSDQQANELLNTSSWKQAIIEEYNSDIIPDM